ncbi:type II toxin-antitoxin system RelE/ParE family toxin [Candidatus Woesearchaeota archaeon]|nr:type II toxin-antitoxin system RelE/ParE family toxin [Candidatus Woesearchaeota archaeon]
MYILSYGKNAGDVLNKLPRSASQRIFKKLEETKENPHRYFIKLTNRPEYKLRVGDYRVIADIVDNKLIILVLEVGHRSRIYKK